MSDRPTMDSMKLARPVNPDEMDVEFVLSKGYVGGGYCICHTHLIVEKRVSAPPESPR